MIPFLVFAFCGLGAGIAIGIAFEKGRSMDTVSKLQWDLEVAKEEYEIVWKLYKDTCNEVTVYMEKISAHFDGAPPEFVSGWIRKYK